MTRRDPVGVTLDYHRRTRHFPHAYARALGYLDWDTQPDPFRRYVGAPLVSLPLVPPDAAGPRYEAALVEGGVPPSPLDLGSVARLFQDSLGLSAWKEAGSARWALRVNPSSGNLHPTEAYLACGAVPGLADAPALWHYRPDVHAFERRADLPGWSRLAADLPPGAVGVGLTSIPWRESWKYGERAFRYCQHDVGHAVAAVAVAAAGLGWATRLVEPGDEAALAALLAVDDQGGAEAELPEALLVVYPAGAAFPPAQRRHLRLPRAERAVGAPAPLSAEHHDWPVVDRVAEATARPAPPAFEPVAPPPAAVGVEESDVWLRRVVHRRRSAVAFDGRTGLERDAFYQVLARTLPGAGQVPFAALPWAPAVDLLLFVHRVGGLAPGLYLLARDAARLPRLRGQLAAGAGWEAAEGAPAGLPLVRLQAADARDAARAVACGQDIAADGVFAVAMITELEPLVERWGAWFYRRLHWEAGAVGQVLYLEAEASGVRGTGIGCFFDELTAEVGGFAGSPLRCLYQFTVGGPVDDPRLRTLPPYPPR